MSVIATAAATPAGSMPSAEAAAMITDHTACTSAQWNEAVLVRRMTEAVEAELFDAEFVAWMRKAVEPKSGADRDDTVLALLSSVTRMLLTAEEQAAARR